MELLNLKDEYSDPKSFNEQYSKLLEEKKSISVEKEYYKEKYNTLSKELVKQIGTLKKQLESAEQRLEDKCNKTQKYTNMVIGNLDLLIKKWDKEPELVDCLVNSKELLKRTLGTEIEIKTFESVLVQTDGIFILKL